LADGDAAGAAQHFTDAIDILGDLAPYVRAETEHRVAIALTLDGERRLAIERLTSALAWDVRQTITHVCDAVGWFAAHLAFRSPRRLRFDFHAHRDASNAEMLDVLEAAAGTLGQLARAAPADARA
jgi:hypothetical protein